MSFLRRYLDIFCSLLVALSALLFFYRGIFGNSMSLIWDAYNQMYPLMVSFAGYFKTGEIPLWLPSLFCGFPIIGDPQSQIFYPLNILLYLLAPVITPKSVYVQMVLHLSFSGAAMFWLARGLQLSRPASVIAAFSYMYGGFFIGHMSHISMLNTAAWLPVLILSLRPFCVKPDWRLTMLPAFVLAFIFFAGHPPTFFYILWFVFVYLLFEPLVLAPKGQRLRKVVRLMAGFVLMVLFALLLYAVQLVPALHVFAKSTRFVPLSFPEAVASGTVYVKEWVGLLSANYFGAVSGRYWGSYEHTQHYMFMGIIPFILFFFGGLGSLRNKAWEFSFFCVSAVFWLLMASGSQTWLYPFFFQWMPGLAFFRAPAYGMFLFFFCAAMTAAYGLDFLSSPKAEIKERSGCVLLAASAGFLFWLMAPAEPIVELKRFMLAGVLDSGVTYLLKRGVPFLLHHSLALRFLFDPFFIWMILLVIVLLFLPKKMLSGRFRAMIPLLVFAELFLPGHQAAPAGRGVSNADIEQKTVSERRMENFWMTDGKLYRAFGSLWAFPGNIPVRSGFDLASGYLPLAPRRFFELFDYLKDNHFGKFLDLCNVKFIKNEGHPMAIRDSTFPRAWFLNCMRTAPSDQEWLQLLTSVDIKSQGVVHERDEPVFSNFRCAAEISQATVRAIQYKKNRIEVEVDVPDPAILFLSEAFDEGWIALANGHEVPIVLTNYYFMSVPLGKGTERVVFLFKPLGFHVSAWISGVAVGVLLIAGFFATRGARQPR